MMMMMLAKVSLALLSATLVDRDSIEVVAFSVPTIQRSSCHPLIISSNKAWRKERSHPTRRYGPDTPESHLSLPKRVGRSPGNLPCSTTTTTTTLFYRALQEDEDDESAALIKVQTRAPPGFDMNQALSPQQNPRTAMNLPLIRALLLNQGLVLGLAVVISSVILLANAGLDGFAHLNEILKWTGTGPDIFDFSLTPQRLAWGFGGALPILALSSWIDSSDKRIFANLNFSTIVMSMTLFGRRKIPPPEFLPPQLRGKTLPTTSWPDACLQSLVLSLTTGVCEEAVFRRLVPSLIVLTTGNSDTLTAWFGSAMLFAAGHVKPSSGLSYNAIVAALQLITGLGFGSIYILSGGDLVPCILAHAFYDFVTFFKTWLDANAQMEYAERMYLEPLPPAVERDVKNLLRNYKGSSVLTDPQLFSTIKRLFYTFDFDKNKSLSLSEVRKGISYLILEKAGTPPPEAVVDRLFREIVDTREPGEEGDNRKDRLTFSDFIRLYSLLGRNSKAAAVAPDRQATRTM